MSQEIVDFQNGKYVWQDIYGKGRSLVPYVEPPKPKKNPNIVLAKDTGIDNFYQKYGGGAILIRVCPSCRGNLGNDKKGFVNFINISGCVTMVAETQEMIKVSGAKEKAINSAINKARG